MNICVYVSLSTHSFTQDSGLPKCFVPAEIAESQASAVVRDLELVVADFADFAT